MKIEKEDPFHPDPDPDPVPPTPESGLDFWDLHGLSMIILWSVFNFFGYIAARFYKHISFWNWIHLTGSGVTAIYTVVLLSISIYKCMNPF